MPDAELQQMIDTLRERDDKLCQDAADEINQLSAALEYAYRAIDFGFQFGSFDFSVLRSAAREFVSARESIMIMREAEELAKEIGLPLGEAVGEYRWRDDVASLVRRNANGTDTTWPMLRDIAAQVQIMVSSAQEHSDGDIVTGYTIKTGALHRIIGLLSAAGFPVSIPIKSAVQQ